VIKSGCEESRGLVGGWSAPDFGWAFLLDSRFSLKDRSRGIGRELREITATTFRQWRIHAEHYGEIRRAARPEFSAADPIIGYWRCELWRTPDRG
jgi:hypothetical protein